MGIGKKLRFEVLKRDGFKCRYCGKPASEKTLEVDHVIAKAQGGSDLIENLVAACFDCNRGKSKNSLGEQIIVARDLKTERKAMKQLVQLRKLDEQREADIKANIEVILNYLLITLVVSEEYVDVKKLRWIAQRIRVGQIPEAAEATERWLGKQWGKGLDPTDDSIVRYFCGVCRNLVNPSWGS